MKIIILLSICVSITYQQYYDYYPPMEFGMRRSGMRPTSYWYPYLLPKFDYTLGFNNEFEALLVSNCLVVSLFLLNNVILLYFYVTKRIK